MRSVTCLLIFTLLCAVGGSALVHGEDKPLPPTVAPEPIDPDKKPLLDALKPRDPTIGNEAVWKSLGVGFESHDFTSGTPKPPPGPGTPPQSAPRAAIVEVLPKVIVLGMVIGNHGPAALVTMEGQRMIVRANSLITDQDGRTWKVTSLAADNLILQLGNRLTLHASFGVAP